jgi:hypothetical protein
VKTYSDWIEEQIALALALKNGCCGGSYADGAIILCVSIATMASCLWIEKDKTDRTRFIEIIAKFPERGFDGTKISAPLISQAYPCLIQPLKISNLPYVYTEDNDLPESTVLGHYATCLNRSARAGKKDVREYSYANLLYRHVRCGFIHKYSTTDAATNYNSSWEMHDSGAAKIYYANYLEPERVRKIYFPLEWISEVARNIAAGMDSESSRCGKYFGRNLDLPVPDKWWTDGGHI